MADVAGSTGHGSTAHRGPAGQPLTAQPTPAVPLQQERVADERAQPPQRVTVPSPRLGDGGPEPVGLGEILTVDADTVDRAPGDDSAPGAVRRPDLLAGPLLLLAGLAAGVSLLVVWVHGGVSGFDLVGARLLDVREDPTTLARAGAWQPLAVVGGGTVLFVLGLLMYVPARTHRFLGVLALLASLVVAAAVLLPLAEAGWDTASWAVGAWCAAAVGGLGLLGALKAVSTGPARRRRR
jgi:hypothetical protein